MKNRKPTESQTYDLSNDRSIIQYLHCTQCMEELPVGKSPSEYRRISVGFTALGLQVWCDRHHANIVHIDFQGARHPANTTRKASRFDNPEDLK